MLLRGPTRTSSQLSRSMFDIVVRFSNTLPTAFLALPAQHNAQHPVPAFTASPSPSVPESSEARDSQASQAAPRDAVFWAQYVADWAARKPAYQLIRTLDCWQTRALVFSVAMVGSGCS